MEAMSQLLLILAAFAYDPAGTLGPAIERSVRFVERVECRSASGDGHLTDVEIRVAVPTSDKRQTVSDLRFQPRPTAFLTDAEGNRFAVYRRARMVAGESVEVGWSCRARLSEISHDVDRARLRPLSEAPKDIRETYLRSADKYGMDDPRMREVAASLGEKAKDPLDLAFLINEHLREQLTYRNDGKWESADRVLRNGHGSCSEYNFAFIALARLNGMPARYVGASALRSTGPKYEDTVHHRWTEVYLPGHGWFPVDASRNDGEDGTPINRWFGKTSAALLVLMKGEGGSAHPLRWGYVAAIDARRFGDARISKRKRFVWTDPSPAKTAESNGDG